MTFDPSKGETATISYSLNKPGCIRIRLVHRNQPNLVIRTLQDWTDQGFGKHELKWDGRDTQDIIVDNKKFFVLFEAKDQGKGRQHHDHPKELCQDPFLAIQARPNPSQSVNGWFEIETSVLGETYPSSDKAEYQVRYYVDYELADEERFEKGIKNFLFKIDTKKFQNGDHLIIVNVEDLHDHIGSAALRIHVEN